MSTSKQGSGTGTSPDGPGGKPRNERIRIVAMAVAGLLLIFLATVMFAARGCGSEKSLPPASVGSAKVKNVKLQAPGQILKPGEKARVRMETTEGDFTIELDIEAAPKTTNSFAYLAKSGFYDDLGFHRIIHDFVIQGGDPRGTGSGGPGYRIVEPPPDGTTYTPGTVAMAKGPDEAPGTSGSQFFVVTGPDASHLGPEYALVGKVTEGMDVVEKIDQLAGPAERPVKSVLITGATLERG